MSTDFHSDVDRDRDSDDAKARTSWRSTILAALLMIVIVICGYYAIYRPFFGSSDKNNSGAKSAVAEKQAGGSPTSPQKEVSLDTAIETVQSQTVGRYEHAQQEMEDVRNQVERLTRIVIGAESVVEQGNSDLGKRKASRLFKKADLIALKNQAEALSPKLAALRRDFEAWTKLNHELLMGDRGKRIAANEKLVAEFSEIEMPLVTQHNIQTWSDVLPLLIGSMQRALSQDMPSLIPLEPYQSWVDQLTRQIDEASMEIRNAQLAVATFEQKNIQTGVPPETPLLWESLRQYETSRQQAGKSPTDADAQKLRKQLTRKLLYGDVDSVVREVSGQVEMMQKRAEVAGKVADRIRRLRQALDTDTEGKQQPATDDR